MSDLGKTWDLLSGWSLAEGRRNLVSTRGWDPGYTGTQLQNNLSGDVVT